LRRDKRCNRASETNLLLPPRVTGSFGLLEPGRVLGSA
jgi:hypothetical protein